MSEDPQEGKPDLLRKIVPALATGIGFGTAMAIADVWLDVVVLVDLTLPLSATVARALLHIGLGALLGAVALPVRQRFGPTLHLVAVSLLWIGLSVFALTPIEPNFRRIAQMGLVGGLVLALSGRVLGRRSMKVPAILGAVLLTTGLLQPVIQRWQVARANGPGPRTGEVLSFEKISATSADFTGALRADDAFGQSLTLLGDLDGDRINDVVVGAHTTAGEGFHRGAVWILLRNADGTVKDRRLIGDADLPGSLRDDDLFGTAIAALGDLDGNGVPDLAVSADRDDAGGTDSGAVYVLLLERGGHVSQVVKIGPDIGGFEGALEAGDLFGSSLAALGDVNGDGIVDLAVGAAGDDDGGSNRGAVWILYLNTDGTTKGHGKISQTSGGFDGVLGDGGRLGTSVAAGVDLDGDGVGDLAVGNSYDAESQHQLGAVWIFFLDRRATVVRQQKINDKHGGFTGKLDRKDRFGRSMAWLGDIDGDGIADLAVGATLDDDGVSRRGKDTGALWLLFMRANGTVKAHRKISKLAGNFGGVIDDEDSFGTSVLAVPDDTGDGLAELLVGAREDDDGYDQAGAVWRLRLVPGRPGAERASR